MNDREAALDRMLDDLKTTVGSDGEMTTPDVRSDSTLVSSFRTSSYNDRPDSFLEIFRSSSRNEGRSSLSGSGSRGGSVEDGGRVKHSRHEYRTPDNQTHVVTEKYEYDTGDSSKTKHYQKKVMKSTYSNYNQMSAGSLEDPPHLRAPPPQQISPTAPTDTKGTPSSTLTNGTLNKYDVDDGLVEDSKSGEVRRIVWRNRFEKTYETQDSSNPPAMSIEEESRRRETTQRQHTSTTSSTTQRGPVSPRQPQLQCAVYWPGFGAPPNVSPGSQSWKEPIPMPTPPQLSPREPGVAYIYTYGGQQGGTGVQPLPPLNYVNVPGPQSVPPSEGAPSPTPSGQLQSQPIIYHYSYHYTIQPGQQPPDGVPLPPSGTLPTPTPALQVAPGPQSHTQVLHSTHTSSHTTNSGHPGHPGHSGHPGHPSEPVQPAQPTQQAKPAQPSQPGQPSSTVNYNIHSYSSSSRSTTNTVNRSDTSTLGYPGRDGPGSPVDDPSYPRKPNLQIQPRSPSDPECHTGLGQPGQPGQPGQSGQPGHPGSINITINKTTTTRTIHEGYPGAPDGSDVPPVTSTPYSSRGRSVSPEPRTPPGGPTHITYHTHVTRTSHSDSLDRVKRPRNETLPFPNTSPIKSTDNGKIPRRVDDLMTSFSDSEDGGPGGPHPRTLRPDPADHEPLLPHNNQVAVRADADAKAVAVADADAKREPTKNKAGPPVYYPPGHELFHETMHTMTLKEGRRRGKAKWRMEKSSGYKESSSHSESKGGMTMVPVCLPLCCGAACVIM